MKFILDSILAITWGIVSGVGFMGVMRGFGTDCVLFWYAAFIIALVWTLSKIK